MSGMDPGVKCHADEERGISGDAEDADGQEATEHEMERRRSEPRCHCGSPPSRGRLAPVPPGGLPHGQGVRSTR